MARTKYKKKVKNGNVYFFYRLNHKRLRSPRDLYGKTVSELEERIESLIHELDQNVISDKTYFTDYLSKWMEDVLFINKKQSTKNIYRSAFKNYIQDSFLSRIRLKDLTAFDVQDYYKKIIDVQNVGNGTLATLTKIIHPCIRYAYTQGKITTDFSRSIIVPKGKPKSTTARRASRSLTPQEEKTLRKAIAGTPIECFVITALGSGLRHGELLALTWDDVDFLNSVISVNKSYRPNTGVTPPKTESSIRQVPVKKEVINALKQHKAKQDAWIEKLANKYEDNNLVFPGQRGKYKNPSSNILALKKISAENNLDQITVHDFRDTYATRLYEQTNNLKMIQQLLGHSNIETTANEYTHVSLEQKSQFVKALENE